MDDEFRSFLSNNGFRFIRFKAGQVAGRYGFARHELGDIQHTLLVHCLEQTGKFDSQRSSPDRFIRVLVERHIATLITSQKRQCRDYRLRQSLNGPHENRQSVPARSTRIPNSSSAIEVGRSELPEWRLLLKCDVERALALLPPHLKQVCRMLMITDGIASVATTTGISRATLYRHIAEIRAFFIQRNLTSYVPELASARAGER